MHNEPIALPITTIIININALSVNSRVANIKKRSENECSAPHNINVGATNKTRNQCLVAR